MLTPLDNLLNNAVNTIIPAMELPVTALPIYTKNSNRFP